MGKILYPETGYWRPQKRSDCRLISRPCPYVSCRYNLYLDVSPKTGAIKINFPDREVWEMQCSCALDVAEDGGLMPEETAILINVSRERIRQIEEHVVQKLRARMSSVGISIEDINYFDNIQTFFDVDMFCVVDMGGIAERVKIRMEEIDREYVGSRKPSKKEKSYKQMIFEYVCRRNGVMAVEIEEKLDICIGTVRGTLSDLKRRGRVENDRGGRWFVKGKKK